MADEIKRVHVRIAGVAYQLAACENEAFIRESAARADEMIRRVLQNSPQLSQNMATVLALVNAMDEISQATRQAHDAKRQRDQYELQLAQTKVELGRMREQNWEMKKDLLKMQTLLAEFEQHLDQIRQSDTKTNTELEKEPEPVHIALETIEEAGELTELAGDELEEPISEEAEQAGEDGEMPPSLQAYQQSRLEDYY